MPQNRNAVIVPRTNETNIVPHYVAGSDVVRVANWITKGVYSAQHEPGHDRLIEFFPLGVPIPPWPKLPQYIENPGDKRFGEFAVDLESEHPELSKRAVCWDRDAFLRRMEGFGPEVDGKQVSPMSLTVVPVGKHWCPWKEGFEYAFRVWWSVQDLDFPHPTKYYLDVKPHRDGRISMVGALARDDQPTTLDDNADGGGGSGGSGGGGASDSVHHSGRRPQEGGIGIAAAQAERWKRGPMSRGWKDLFFVCAFHGIEPPCPSIQHFHPKSFIWTLLLCTYVRMSTYGISFATIKHNENACEKKRMKIQTGMVVGGGTYVRAQDGGAGVLGPATRKE